MGQEMSKILFGNLKMSFVVILSLIAIGMIAISCATMGQKIENDEFLSNLIGKWEGRWVYDNDPSYNGKMNFNISGISDNNLNISGFSKGSGCADSSDMSGTINQSTLIVVIKRPSPCGNCEHKFTMRKQDSGECVLLGRYNCEDDYTGTSTLKKSN